MKNALLLLTLVLFASSSFAERLERSYTGHERNQTEKRHFAKENPCPSTKMAVPSCKGYRIDHIVPICAGGADTKDNMQWQPLGVSLLKDRIERASCLCVRRHGADACPKIEWKR